MKIKRFTDTGKWQDVWYQDLPSKYKLFWNYMLDNCTHYGVWEVNIKHAIYSVGEPFEQNEVKRILGDRIVEIENGRYWFIPKFISFQYGKVLSRDSSPVKKVIEFLDTNPDLLRFLPKITISERVPKGLPKGSLTLKDKEQEQDKEQDEDKEQEQEEETAENDFGNDDTNCGSEADEKPTVKTKKHKTCKDDMFCHEEKEIFKDYGFDNIFRAKWEEWKKFRAKDLKKPITTEAMRKQLKYLNSLTHPVEVMERSIKNGWQGLFGDEFKKHYYKTDLGEEYEVIHGLVEIDGMKFSVPNDKVYTK